MELDDGDVITLIAEIGRLRRKVKCLKNDNARLTTINRFYRQQIKELKQNLRSKNNGTINNRTN